MKDIKKELMKSIHIEKRYNRIKQDQGTQAADMWLSMLIKSVKKI